MGKGIKMAQVHRFGDCVAAYLGDGQTVYMTPADARKFAKALNACARDVGAAKFTSGTFRTVELDFADTGHNGCNYKHKRKG